MYVCGLCIVASVPGFRPAFCCLQYEKLDERLGPRVKYKHFKSMEIGLSEERRREGEGA